MNSLYAGVCSRAAWPFFETSLPEHDAQQHDREPE